MKLTFSDFINSPGIDENGKRIPSALEKFHCELVYALLNAREKSMWQRLVGYVKSRVAQLSYKLRR